MFKKIIPTVIAFFLLLSQTGMAFNIHFCASNVASIAINSTKNSTEFEKNCCGEVEKNAKCCHNKIIKAVEKSETVFVKTIQFSPKFIVPVSNCNVPVAASLKDVLLRANFAYSFNSNAPPLFRRFCQLIFYA